MAGFKCDICGGDIKMQANKTGVCQTCGMQYDLEAIRAMLGQQQSAPVQSAPLPAAPVTAAQNDEIDRETLLAYLGDLRTMETIRVETVAMSGKLDEEKANADKKLSNFKYNKPTEPQLPKRPENLGGTGCLIPFVAIGLLDVVLGLLIGSNLGSFFQASIILIGLFVAIVFLILIHQSKSADKNEITKYEAAMRNYEEAMNRYKAEMEDHRLGIRKEEENNKEFKKEADEHKLALSNEKTELDTMIEKAYNANIIPQQFRNIEGVYYLYDYLSTSNQSLSEALMQANLEAIKQKMDNMIKLQSAQIIQQAQTNAKLDAIIDISEATMNNTAVAAKYAQIAAVNSELNVKLAAESLAYQKAAFWLK
ncbi:MAG: hypothetical protein IKO47_02125 [Ruminococcus sp.]|nr:hypothetical protein [Ruminococcus sp.]